MRRLRWQILVVLATLVIVAVLLLSQQPVLTPILPQAAPGGVYTEGMVGSLGRLNPLLDWNNPADRDVDRLIFSGLIKFDSHGLPQPDLAESWGTSADGTIYNFHTSPECSMAGWHSCHERRCDLYNRPDQNQFAFSARHQGPLGED